MPSLRLLDQIAIWLATLLLVAVSWAYLIDMAQMMGDMSDGAMANMPEVLNSTGSVAGITAWSTANFLNMFTMWAVMMIAMMVPTAIRTLMIFARIARTHSPQVISPTYLFLLGYILSWTLFSVAATLLQWQLDQARLLSPMMVSTSYYLGAFLLASAGIYQFLPIKNACLRHCQSPVHFISNNFKPGYSGALNMGLHHGVFCLGCCWVLMLLLFLAGVMNIVWIFLITLFVLFEKLLPIINSRWAEFSSVFTGIPLILAGILFLLFKLQIA